MSADFEQAVSTTYLLLSVAISCLHSLVHKTFTNFMESKFYFNHSLDWYNKPELLSQGKCYLKSQGGINWYCTKFKKTKLTPPPFHLILLIIKSFERNQLSQGEQNIVGVCLIMLLTFFDIILNTNGLTVVILNGCFT